KSKVTSSILSPNCLRALVRSRTPARNGAPCAARDFTTLRPMVPVAPVTKIFFGIAFLSRQSREAQEASNLKFNLRVKEEMENEVMSKAVFFLKKQAGTDDRIACALRLSRSLVDDVAGRPH